MTEDEIERTRERAYRLWEEAGRPEGRDDHFWQRARREIEAERQEDGTQEADRSQ